MGRRFALVDYQVARFFEDLQSVLPAALEPVPSDIAALVSDAKWFDGAEQWITDDEDEDIRRKRRGLCHEAMNWYQDRALDSMHLKNGPMFHFWRAGDKVTVRWEATGKDAEEVWTIPNGEFTVSVEQFSSAAYTFFDQLIQEMQSRLENIQTKGWTRADCRLDIPSLVSEQRQRANWISEVKDRRSVTDWDKVRTLLTRLSPEIRKISGASATAKRSSG